MHAWRSMKKLQGDCVLWLVLLTGAAQLLRVGTSLPAGMFSSHCRPVSVMLVKCMQECTCPWDQPASPSTTLRSSSLILEMIMGLVMFPLSLVTLTWPSAVGAELITMILEGWDSGRFLMGVWYWPMLTQQLLDSSSSLWGMLPNSSGFVVERITTPSLQPGLTAAPYQLLEEKLPSVLTWVRGSAIFSSIHKSFLSTNPSSCVPVSSYTEQWESLIQRLNTGSVHCGHLHLWHWLHYQ